jgi:WD40 repeat protein
MIVSASYDKSVRLWDVTTGQCRAVIQGFQDRINDIVWIEGSSVNYLATGCKDGMVGMWKVEAGEDRCDVSLYWTTMRGALNVTDATIQGVQGLSQLNKQLLVQRGTVGEPFHRLREANKSATMASVVSKLKILSDITVEDPLSTGSLLVSQLERWLEERKDTLSQDVVDMMASFIKIIHRHK